MNCVGIRSFFFILFTYSHVHNVQASLGAEGIVGGTDAKTGEYTYQVSLSRNSEHICGGAIIASRYILTAAHCVTEDGVPETDPIKIIAGVNDLHNKSSSMRIEVDVIRVYIPKIFSDTEIWNADEKNKPKRRSPGDIAVLLLAKSLHLKRNPHLRKLKLGDPETTYIGEAVVAGFGWNHILTKKNRAGEIEDEIDGFSFGQLRFAKTEVISHGFCSWIYINNNEPPPSQSQICAQVVQPKEGKPEGVCIGDSGGPLVYEGDTVIGVMSVSPLGCQEDVAPALYTRVSSYIDFIMKAAKNIKDPQILETQLVYNIIGRGASRRHSV